MPGNNLDLSMFESPGRNTQEQELTVSLAPNVPPRQAKNVPPSRVCWTAQELVAALDYMDLTDKDASGPRIEEEDDEDDEWMMQGLGERAEAEEDYDNGGHHPKVDGTTKAFYGLEEFFRDVKTNNVAVPDTFAFFVVQKVENSSKWIEELEPLLISGQKNGDKLELLIVFPSPTVYTMITSRMPNGTTVTPLKTADYKTFSKDWLEVSCYCQGKLVHLPNNLDNIISNYMIQAVKEGVDPSTLSFVDGRVFNRNENIIRRIYEDKAQEIHQRQNMVCYYFTGPPGSGKSSLARLLGRKGEVATCIWARSNFVKYSNERVYVIDELSRDLTNDTNSMGVTSLLEVAQPGPALVNVKGKTLYSCATVVVIISNHQPGDLRFSLDRATNDAQRLALLRRITFLVQFEGGRMPVVEKTRQREEEERNNGKAVAIFPDIPEIWKQWNVKPVEEADAE